MAVDHLGPGFAGRRSPVDLFEAQNTNRAGHVPPGTGGRPSSPCCIGRAASLRRLLPRLAASALLRFLAEAAGLLGALALTQQFRQTCASGVDAQFSVDCRVLAGIGLCVSLGFYVSLFRRSTFGNTPGPGRSTPIRRLLSVFAVTALSAGTLTWAGAVPHTARQCNACRPCGLPQSWLVDRSGRTGSNGQVDARWIIPGMLLAVLPGRSRRHIAPIDLLILKPRRVVPAGSRHGGYQIGGSEPDAPRPVSSAAGRAFVPLVSVRAVSHSLRIDDAWGWWTVTSSWLTNSDTVCGCR